MSIAQNQRDATNAFQTAYEFGVDDARAGRYNPTAYFHFNNEVAIMHYDAGHASVKTQDWRWSQTFRSQLAEVERENVGEEISTRPFEW